MDNFLYTYPLQNIEVKPMKKIVLALDFDSNEELMEFMDGLMGMVGETILFWRDYEGDA